MNKLGIRSDQKEKKMERYAGVPIAKLGADRGTFLGRISESNEH
jgi:hypothetical protein